MDQNQTHMGRSILVPSVQELVKEPALTKVPPRYVRTDQEPPLILSNASSPKVLVIDMQRLLSMDSMDSELEKLHHASKKWGFFPLINHGVSTSLLANVKSGTREFFDFPMEEKKFWQQGRDDIEGFGQALVLSEEQKLDWGDLFAMATLPTHLRKPHLFPKLPLQFREALEAYSLELKSIAMKILDLMANALRMEATDMKELFEERYQAIWMNYYPPCPQPELVIGLNRHSDASGLTILLQVNEMEGRQIRKDGMWIPIKPLPDAFVVNFGDTLEILTNGMYRSIEHRATVKSKKERLSIATFYSSKLDGDLGPAASLVTADRPALFIRTSVADYFRGYLLRELHGKSYLDVIRIQNQDEKSI